VGLYLGRPWSFSQNHFCAASFVIVALRNQQVFTTMMMHGWGMGAYPRRFEEQYHCFSVAHADKAHLEVRL
jgi:hypothetical protein